MGESLATGQIETYFERRGTGPDVLLIAGLGDPVEAWEFQLTGLSDRYTLTAFDNRGAGRVPLGDGPVSVEIFADDAAALLRALDIPAAHIAGFSGGSAIAQQLALRHPEMVRSLVLAATFATMDPYMRAAANFWRWLPFGAPSERAFLEAFFLWIYTPRAHADGMVDQIIEEALAFPHKQTPDAMQRTLDAFIAHDTTDRLGQIDAPTLVVAGDLDLVTPPHLGRAVADGIPGARFELMEGEAHQPFQEVPEPFNEMVDAFWREVDAGDRR